jgi:hypothetical protein
MNLVRNETRKYQGMYYTNSLVGCLLEGEFRHPALFLNRKPVTACLLQYAVNVVFHGLRGEV